MKITLIHCYSDFNKGDLGIILSTINQLKKMSPTSQISGVSTYNLEDSQYKTDHEILKKYLTQIYPCIFGLLYFKFNGKKYNSGILKFLKFLIEFCRLGPLLILPRNTFFLKFFLKKNEQQTFENLMKSDLVISKGGSFLCNENNLRSKVAFFRLVYINLLLKKYKKEYIILGQSLGPVYGKKSIKVLNHVLDGASDIFLREKLCLKAYPYIKSSNCSEIVVNDIAFTMNDVEPVENEILNKKCLKIGLTVKFPDNSKEYDEMILGAIKYCIDKYNATFIIFPQVTVDKDIEKAKDIYFKLDDNYKSNVHIFNNNYTPYELRFMYSKMDLFVGTRLHSTIFAMSAKVPCINIEYHGTKSLGIYQELKLEELVITKSNFNSDFLIKVIERIIKDRSVYINKLELELENINNNISKALGSYILK